MDLIERLTALSFLAAMLGCSSTGSVLLSQLTSCGPQTAACPP